MQQWEGLIAVNYAARAAGITRHMRAPEALQKCPHLRLVHVQTLGGGVASASDPAAAPRAESAQGLAPSAAEPALPLSSSEQAGGAQPEAPDKEPPAGSRDKEKACLERYRQASAKIIGLIRQQAPQVMA